MNEFWSRHNRRIGKLIDKDGQPATWQVRDWNVSVEGLKDAGEVAAVVRQRFAETFLGDVTAVTTAEFHCSTSRACSLYAVLLLRETLRQCEVPHTALIRQGFPVPTTAHRIYKIDRDSNLEVVGPKTKKKPVVGDVFFYSFDRTTYFWGQVVRDDVTHQLGATLCALFFKGESSSTDAVPSLDFDDLLTEPLLIDNECWKRGLFATVSNHPVSDVSKWDTATVLPNCRTTYGLVSR